MRIPQDLDSFKKAPANAGRRAADVILLGEARDPETLDGMIQLAEIGVAAYSTVHTRSVADTPQRIINEFPADKQNQISTMLISSLRLVIQQRLVPRKGGGRVALREFLDFPQERRRELAGVKPQELNNHIQPMVEDDGQSIREAARMKYQQGLITEETYENVMSNRAAMEDLEDVA
jgi:defect-in-organelle-trafficking protein DotB